MLRCSALGHGYVLTSDGPVVRWRCERCGAAGGEKRYGSAQEAAMFAAAFDRRATDDLGGRAPCFGLLPLRVARAVRRRRRVG